MLELAIVGAKNSGKTTVIEGLIKYFINEGYRVATIKHTSHSHQFDTQGKDSYRHRQAGAMLTVAQSDDEVAIFASPESLDIRQTQSLTNNKIDIWLIEGDRHADRPKVLVTRHLSKLAGAPPENVIAAIGPDRPEGVPAHFDSNDYAGLGSFVCRTMLEKKTEIQK